KEEMDIMDINIGDITSQYLDYIRMMKELDLEVAGEFVAMAATLIHIKSRMLLPTYDDKGEAVEVEDPRKELVQKLLDYQKYQEVAKKLYDRPLLNRDVFSRGVREDFQDEEAAGAVVIEDDGLFSLIAAYRRTVRKAMRAVHKVRPKVQSIAGRIFEMKDRLIVGARITLRELLGANPAEYRTNLLITFLSMLELGRMGFVSVFQAETYGDIHIETKKAVERNVLERVQEFDSGDFESVAKSIINDAIDEKIDMQQTMMEAMPTETEAGQLSLVDAAPLTEETFGEQFVETDSELFEEDAATDDEILAAEEELKKHEAESGALPEEIAEAMFSDDRSEPEGEAQV
ncbi:MAG: hypothetical protein EOP05_08030, partial [Proteobacteria bacterium]